MRAFIAIRLSKEAEEFLSGLQEKLKTARADVKWVQPRNIHLTLKFLGESDDKQIEAMKEALERIAKETKQYELSLFSVGAFPNTESPNIIWAGIDKGRSETIILAQKIEDEAAKTGIPKEKRPFACHITLGRSKSLTNQEGLTEQLNLLRNGFPGPVPCLVEKITLFKSTLTQTGPVYEILCETNLRNT